MSVPPHCNSFHLVGLNWKEALQLVVRNLWRKKSEWRAPNKLLVVQTGVRASQAEVFKAHPVPQGLCENVINALKLLTNQLRGGDCPVQSIVQASMQEAEKELWRA